MFEDLGAISRDLLDDLERARPGFPTAEAEFRQAAEERLRLRLSDLEAQYPILADERGRRRVWQEIETVFLPRYMGFGRTYAEMEKKGGGGWRGGDVVSRVVLGLGGLAVGGFLIWAPFIPIWEKWVPFAMMCSAPFIPDMQKAYHLHRHQKRLEELSQAMDAAGRALSETEPLDLYLAPSPSISTGGSATRPSVAEPASHEPAPEPVPVGGGRSSSSEGGRR